MFHRLYETIPSSISSNHGPDNSLRMIQILRNEPSRALLISWPPNTPYSEQQQYPTSANFANDLGQLIKSVKMESGGGGEAKTSCSRRFRSTHHLSVPVYGSVKSVKVDSIFIPHGEPPQPRTLSLPLELLVSC